MAGWKNDQDISRDMDILSGIRSPEGKVKSYSSWGRGQTHSLNAPVDTDSFPELQEKTSPEEFEWYPVERTIGKLPDSISRGRKLEILKENCHRGRELEVHEQLRAAVGPGYSNAFIEESFKQRVCVKSGQQFEDSEEAQTDHSAECTKSVSPEVQIPKENKSKRKKGRRYRNAVLESLERMNTSESTTEATNLSNVKAGTLFGGKGSNIPPAGYLPGRFISTSFVRDVSEKSFEYKESEFPNL